MKNYILNTFAFCLIVAFVTMGAMQIRKSSGAHPGSTGAPGDLTCADAEATGCHVDATIANGKDVNSLVMSDGDVPVTKYAVNKSYELRLRVEDATGKRFGFQIVALDSKNRTIGTFSKPGSTTTRIQILNANSRQYVTHITASIQPLSAGMDEWIISWKAPSIASGPITFYYSTNVTNGNLQNTGDKIFLSSFTVGDITNSVSDDGDREFRCSPNPANDVLHLNAPSLWNAQAASIKLFDAKGMLVYGWSAHDFSAGMCTISLPVTVPSGMYMIEVSHDADVFHSRVVIER